jgi:hypothetical protein
MDEPIDRKFTFCATSCEHGNEHSHMDAIVFLAKDAALIPTLHFYRDKCFHLEAKEEQLRGIDLLIERVQKYQDTHPIKVADVDIPDMAGILDDNGT